ncbi:MAG TPA: HD domain-containing phosphohydrolase [Gemmatimonadaceae bacterium]|nr:HD domain-containing phosphohydrolase [Gemmatimonadaceae bacterium]
MSAPLRTPPRNQVHRPTSNVTLVRVNAWSDARILIIDDHQANVDALKRILRSAGFACVNSTTDPLVGVRLVQTWAPDLVLLDLHMPNLDGFGVLDSIRPHLGNGSYLPVVMLTGDSNEETKRRALSSGAKDFLTKPFDATEVVLRIGNLLETRSLYSRIRNHNEQLEQRVVERTREFEQAQFEILQRLAAAAEFRDDETGQHTERVGELAARLATQMGLPVERVDLIRRAAPLHDVGKIGIPDSILRKAARLTPQERRIMQTHSTIGAAMLAGGHSALVKTAEQIARSHHERWDGGGYPDGIGGENIPLEARLVAVADYFDALTHNRPYRAAWSVDRTIKKIVAERERHFDPSVVDALLGLGREALEP